jgi:ABC-2 type transport system permease protein
VAEHPGRGFVRGARVVFRRELGACFDAPVAYVFGAVFLALSTSIYMNGFFLNARLEMTSYFERLPYLFIAFVPAITMRLWAEERSLRTQELLFTLPLSPAQVLIGKYVAALVFFTTVLAGTLPIPLMLYTLGSPVTGLIVGGYLAALSAGALFLALGMFCSGLTRDQIVAFVLAAMIGFCVTLSGHPQVVDVLDGLWLRGQVGSTLRGTVSILPHYEALCSGVIGLGDAVYFAAVSAFFLGLNASTLRRGSEFGD